VHCTPFLPRPPAPRKGSVTIDAEVDPYLELAEIHRRVIERRPGTPFQAVKGSSFPVVLSVRTAKRIDLLWAQAGKIHQTGSQRS
jgi:UbiD family decarboxylase